MFTRQHYKEVAETIRCLSVDEETRRKIAITFAGMFACDNVRFRRDLFMDACGVKEVAE